MRDMKKVPLKSVKKGDTFTTLIINDRTIFTPYEVIKNEGAFVLLKKYGREENISTENAFIEVPLTEEEFQKNIKKKNKN